MRKCNFIIVLLLFLATCGVLFGATLKFAWDPHEQASLIEYFSLYMGQRPGVYQGAIMDQEGGESTSTSVGVDIPSGECRYFALTAVGHDGSESEYSNEVSVCVPVEPEPEPTPDLTPDPVPDPVPEPEPPIPTPEPQPEPETPPPAPEPDPPVVVEPDPEPVNEPPPTPKRKNKHKKWNPLNSRSCFIDSVTQ